MQLLPDPPPQDTRPGEGAPRGASTDHGAIAQLGERLVCNQKVTGSIPVGSTSSAACLPNVRARSRDGSHRESSPERALPLRQRLLFKNPEVFVDDAEFSKRTIFHCCSLRMSRSHKCDESAPYPQTPWGYMVKRISAYGGCLGGRRR